MIDRRIILTSMLAGLGLARTRMAYAQAAMTKVTAYAFSFAALAGGEIRLADYSGRPVLVVNTASLCGFTPQYAGLQQLWTEFHDRGLMIVGVSLQRFRRPGAWWCPGNRANRSAPIWRDFSNGGKSNRERRGGASILQMGCQCAAEGSSALELPQISDWFATATSPRSFPRPSNPWIHESNGNCAGAGRLLTQRIRIAANLTK